MPLQNETKRLFSFKNVLRLKAVFYFRLFNFRGYTAELLSPKCKCATGIVVTAEVRVLIRLGIVDKGILVNCKFAALCSSSSLNLRL